MADCQTQCDICNKLINGVCIQYNCLKGHTGIIHVECWEQYREQDYRKNQRAQSKGQFPLKFHTVKRTSCPDSSCTINLQQIREITINSKETDTERVVNKPTTLSVKKKSRKKKNHSQRPPSNIKFYCTGVRKSGNQCNNILKTDNEIYSSLCNHCQEYQKQIEKLAKELSSNKFKTSQTTELTSPIIPKKKKPVVISTDIVFTKKIPTIVQIDFKVIGTPKHSSTEVEGYCPSHYVGFILGPHGENIRKLRSIVSIYITIYPDVKIINSKSYRLCYLRGSSINVQKCICELFKLMNETDDISKIRLPEHKIFNTHNSDKLKKKNTIKATSSSFDSDNSMHYDKSFNQTLPKSTPPPLSAPQLSTPPLSTPPLSAPQLSTTPLSTPQLSTPQLSTPPPPIPLLSTSILPQYPVSLPIAGSVPLQYPPLEQTIPTRTNLAKMSVGLLTPHEILQSQYPTEQVHIEPDGCAAFIFECKNSTIETFQKELIFALDKSCTQMVTEIGFNSNIFLYNTDTYDLHGLYKMVTSVNTQPILTDCYSYLQAQLHVKMYGESTNYINLPFISSWKKGPLNQQQYQLLMHLVKHYDLFKDVRQLVI